MVEGRRNEKGEDEFVVSGGNGICRTPYIRNDAGPKYTPLNFTCKHDALVCIFLP